MPKLIKLFERLGELPVCYLGDENVYVKTGEIKDGELLVSLINLSFDPIENLELKIDRKVNSIERLTANGEKVKVDFTNAGEKYVLDLSAVIADPVILFIK